MGRGGIRGNTFQERHPVKLDILLIKATEIVCIIANYYNKMLKRK